MAMTPKRRDQYPGAEKLPRKPSTVKPHQRRSERETMACDQEPSYRRVLDRAVDRTMQRQEAW